MKRTALFPALALLAGCTFNVYQPSVSTTLTGQADVQVTPSRAPQVVEVAPALPAPQATSLGEVSLDVAPAVVDHGPSPTPLPSPTPTATNTPSPAPTPDVEPPRVVAARAFEVEGHTRLELTFSEPVTVDAARPYHMQFAVSNDDDKLYAVSRDGAGEVRENPLADGDDGKRFGFSNHLNGNFGIVAGDPTKTWTDFAQPHMFGPYRYFKVFVEEGADLASNKFAWDHAGTTGVGEVAQ